VGHYTPDATAKNESTAPAESRRGILFGVVKVSADATLTGPRPFRPNRAHASRNSPSTRLGHPDRHVGGGGPANSATNAQTSISKAIAAG
jgi:hypothetical protein